MNDEQELFAALEKIRESIREANSWLKANEGVDLLYYWPEDKEPEMRAKMQEILEYKENP